MENTGGVALVRKKGGGRGEGEEEEEGRGVCLKVQLIPKSVCEEV